MSKKANTTAIGAFVIGAVLLAAAAVVIFGSERYFTKKYKYVIYFQGNVKGLNVGAPVLFKGVKVGQVADILMELDAKTMQFRVPVIVELTGGKTTAINTQYYKGLEKAGQDEIVVDLINRGLRAQLATQSFVTGLLYVKLDFFPEKEIVMLGDESLGSDLEITEIPAIPSSMEEISRTIENIPLGEIARNLEDITHGIDRLVSSSSLAEIMASVDEATVTFKQMVKDLSIQSASLTSDLKTVINNTDRLVLHIDKQLEPVARGFTEAAGATAGAMNQARETLALEKGPAADLVAELKRSFATAASALEQADVALKNIEAASAEDSEVIYNLNAALVEIAMAARSIRTVADYLERHPESLLRGKGDNGGN